MGKSAKRRRNRGSIRRNYKTPDVPNAGEQKKTAEEQKKTVEDLDKLPVTYQEISDFFGQVGEFNPFTLRAETFRRIENVLGRPLICYVTKTTNVPPGIPAYIDDSDLIAFGDLVHLANGDSIDILLISNGGSAEATERIVYLLRERFKNIRFILPANAYSAATLMSFAGNEIIMSPLSTLGPIDPQINGIPSRAILRSFERLEQRLKEEGPQAITAYMPLLQKYDLHMLEICRSAEDLSRELARTWISKYMLQCTPDDERVNRIVDFFASYDVHKSHARGINRQVAREIGLNVTFVEKFDELSDLLRSLRNQYDLWFDQFPFYKLFEDVRGTHWGRRYNIQNEHKP